METLTEPVRVHCTAIDDSRRWAGFRFRPDDIVISTPPKSGTTWMQGIVRSLLWPAGDAPGPAFELGIWVDARFVPPSEMLAAADEQPHRRFLKSHSPADAIPLSPQASYIAVYRDPCDTLVSWANHRASMRPEVMEFLNSTAEAEGIPVVPDWDGDLTALVDEMFTLWSPIDHLASFWEQRERTNVLLVHYADLKADLAGEMRRIADFLAIDLTEEQWPAVVERCTFEAMRAEYSEKKTTMDMGFKQGAQSFFHEGTNGRGRQQLGEHDQARIAGWVEERLPADAAEWFLGGSLAVGRRPGGR